LRLQRPGLPRLQPSTTLPYRALLASLLTLWRKHGTPRRAAIAQGLLSIGFSAFWSTLAIMLHAAPFHLDSAASGAFGLAALAFAILSLAAWWPMKVQLVLLAAGAVLFDPGVQASLLLAADGWAAVMVFATLASLLVLAVGWLGKNPA